MPRFVLAVTILSYVLAPFTLAADVPENPSSAELALAKAAPVYVKIIWPVDPAGVVGSERPIVIGRVQPIVESWITNLSSV